MKCKTKKQIDAELSTLKKDNPFGLWVLETYIDEDEAQTRRLIVTKPDRRTRTIAEKVAQNDAYKGVEIFLRGMYKGGDDLDEVINNESAIMTAGEAIIELITIKRGKLTRA